MGWGNLPSNMEMGLGWASGKLRDQIAVFSVFLKDSFIHPQRKCSHLLGARTHCLHCRNGDDAGSEGYFKGELLAHMWSRKKRMRKVYRFNKPYPASLSI